MQQRRLPVSFYERLLVFLSSGRLLWWRFLFRVQSVVGKWREKRVPVGLAHPNLNQLSMSQVINKYWVLCINSVARIVLLWLYRITYCLNYCKVCNISEVYTMLHSPPIPLPIWIIMTEMLQIGDYFNFENETKTEIPNVFWVNEAQESRLIFTFIWKWAIIRSVSSLLW